MTGACDTADLPVASEQLGRKAGARSGPRPKWLGPRRWYNTGWPVGIFFSRSGVFDGGDALGDRARLEHPRQGFLPARNVWSLNPWHFDSRFPAAKCVFELEYKLSGERNSSADTVVSPSPEFALVDRLRLHTLSAPPAAGSHRRGDCGSQGGAAEELLTTTLLGSLARGHGGGPQRSCSGATIPGPAGRRPNRGCGP